MAEPLSATPIETDAVIVGAGPVGLYQVFQLGLLEIKAHVIDALPHPGGQCAELYPDKPIYDIPGLQVCTGRELTDKLLAQIAPFAAQFHYGQEVSEVERQTDGRLLVRTAKGTSFLTQTLFIAAGVGAFQARTLQVESAAQFAPPQLAYHPSSTQAYAGQDVVVLGGDDAALEYALRLCPLHADGHPHKAASVTLLHRRDVFQAASETQAKVRALCAAGHMKFIAGQILSLHGSAGALSSLEVLLTDASTCTVPAQALIAFLGLSPKLGPIAKWGLDMERKQLVVNTETFATSEPAIFAVGDINTYPGKKKLILCGFHECVLAAFGAAAIVFPDQRQLLQYTTTSTKLHALLGV